MNIMENEIKRFWSQRRIYEKAKNLRKGEKKFYMLDGPPYATGYTHIGTAWNKILKDCYIRFFRMMGFDVWDKPGYDTHGLPIENKVQDILRFKSKAEIEKYGIAKFIERCRKFATQYIDTMNQEFYDLGVWMDWSSPYLTLTNDYIESAWHTFKIAFEKGLLYQDLYPVHVCPNCETVVAYNEIEYGKVSDPSIYVKFPVKKNEFLLIWTTTPWTLPANTGVMVNPNAVYVKVKLEKEEKKFETLIIAKELSESVMKKVGNYKVVETMKGKKLKDLKYIHPLKGLFPFIDDLEKNEKCYRVVLSDQFVSLEEGTGLVHCAPGHGGEDYKVGLDNDLPIISPVKLNGKFDERCGTFSNMFVKSADRLILDELKNRNLILLEEKIVHDYPLCWRCGSPLIIISQPQWFFKITNIRKKMLEENENVNWQPNWAKQRFKNWLEHLGDWPISRQRYWGIPLPIWICDDEKCRAIKVIGSRDDLPNIEIEDLHRPYVDEIKLTCNCGSKMSRVKDILDVWFDSGLASWASLGYPKDEKLFERLWPADLNIEGPDQIRGWWNSQLITSVITFDKAPFKNILFHGFVLDAHGVKMAKSKGNIITPKDVIKKYSRDVLRFYLLSIPAWNDFYFDWRDIEAIAKSFLIIENSFNFVETYVSRLKKKELRIEDMWILSKLNSLITSVIKNFETYNVHKSALEIKDFIIEDFSRTYIKLVRDRVWPSYGGDDAAFYTLYEVSKALSRLLAPICPFLAERIHQRILRKLGETNESVHLCNFPVPDKNLINKELEEMMDLARSISEYANVIRHENKIKLRWPLRSLIVGDSEKVRDVVKLFNDVLKRMCNVKEVRFGSVKESREFEGIKIFLDLQIDDELRKEAMVRELIRKIQDMRKKTGLTIKDKITLYLKELKEISGYEDIIKKEVIAKTIKFGKILGKKDKLTFNGKEIDFGIEKVK